MVEQGRIFKFLAGLDDELDEVRARIIGRHTLLSPGEVFSEIRREANRRSVMLVPVSTDTTTLVAVGASARQILAGEFMADRHIQRPTKLVQKCLTELLLLLMRLSRVSKAKSRSINTQSPVHRLIFLMTH